jgi:hypothetical protein
MKKLLTSFVVLTLLISLCPQALHAERIVPAEKIAPAESPEMQALKNRIQEIKAMDKSTLSRAQKKDLRQELRGMSSAASGNNRGIYLSIGAIVIIILLLILLL